MKHLALLLFTLHFSLLTLSLFAAVPLRWTVETSRVQPVAFDAIHGETLALEAAFNTYGTPLQLAPDDASLNLQPFNSSTFQLFYQTNGMGSAWWTIPATVSSNRVSATFAPTNDPGAPVVMGFLGSTGEIYRAAFTLRFRHGPGATPNMIEPPVQTLDFSHITVLNPPWGGGGGGGVDTNAVRALIESAGHLATTGGVMTGSIVLRRPGENALVSDVTVSTNGVSGWHYTAAGDSGYWQQFSFDWWDLLTSESDPSVPSWAKAATPPDGMTANAVVLTNSLLKTKSGTSITAENISGAVPLITDRYGNKTAIKVGTRNGDASLVGGKSFTQGEDLIAKGNYSHAEGRSTSVYGDYSHAEGRSVIVKAADEYSWTWNGKNQSYTSHGAGTFSINPNGGTSGLYIGNTNLAWHVSDAIANAGHLTQSAADAAYYPLAKGEAWSTYWDGDDVRVTVTNYDSSARLPSLYIEQRTNEVALATNLFRTVWRELAHWEQFLGEDSYYWSTNWPGFSTWSDALEASIDEKADRAWGFYDSHTGKYSPDGYTQVSSEHIILAKDMSYQKTVTTSASVWVLTADTPYEPTGVSTNGSFQIKDGDGNVQFEIVKGDKVTVAAQANAVEVEGATLYVTYNVIANEHPTCEVCLSLTDAAWKAETASDCPATVSWSGSSGAYVAAITPKTTTSSCFVKATYQRGGDTYINNRCAVGMSQIVLNGTTYNLGTATIDGHTVLTLTPAN